MYQAPVAMNVNQAPARPKFRLWGRQVPQEMFYATQQAKRAGRRVFMDLLTLHGDDTQVLPGECDNCVGAGYFMLDVAISGPLKDMPAGGQGTADENPSVHLRPAWHANAWWLVARELYRCPLCNDKREIVL